MLTRNEHPLGLRRHNWRHARAWRVRGVSCGATSSTSARISYWMWGSRMLVRSAVATVTPLRMRRSFCAAPPRPPPAHEAARKAGPRWCVTYPPAAPATPEKPFWADAIGMAGFGLVGLQWLMSDMLHLRAVALASSTSMILYNMRAVGKPLVDTTLRTRTLALTAREGGLRGGLRGGAPLQAAGAAPVLRGWGWATRGGDNTRGGLRGILSA